MSDKSCFGCPSLLAVNEAAIFFRKSVGVPVCARYGKVMGSTNTPHVQKEKVAKQIASSCPDHGKERPQAPDWNKATFTVTLPDPEVFGKVQNQPNLVLSCNTCSNFVREDVVATQLGWGAGLCAAKGKLLLGNRYTYEANACDVKSFGSVRTDLGNLMVLPEYDEGFLPTDDPVKNFFKAKAAGFVDPTEYQTDKPVDDDDVKHGIRAWRAIFDPITENTVYLPIYRTDFFDTEQQTKIPRTGSKEHPEDYVDHAFLVYKVAVLWTELDETPAVWSMPGTGKTELFRHLAWMMNMPFERFSITNSTELEDLAGKMHYSPEKGTYWTDGRFTKAWSSPCVIVVDEPNTGPPDVWQYFRPLTDNSKQLVLDMNNGEHRDRDTDCYVGMAMNPAWDAMNVGAHMIGNADADRLMHMQLELPPEALEKEIIKTACRHDGYDLPSEKLDTIMKIAKDVRAITSSENNSLSITWAIRPQLKVARASRWFDWLTVYRMAAADFLEPEAQAQLLDVVRSHTA